MKCRECNYENREGCRYCENCGAPMEVSSGYMSDISSAPAQNTQNQQNYYGQPDNYGQPGGSADNWSMFQFDSSRDTGYNESEQSPRYVGFGEAIKLYFKNYFDFNSRSTRSEYWFAFLFVFLVSLGVSFINSALKVTIGADALIITKIISTAQSLVFLIPNLSVQVRRLHDVGKSGWWALGTLFIALGTIVLMLFAGRSAESISGILCLMYIFLLAYGITLLVFLCRPSDGRNAWGYPAKPTYR